MSTAEQHQQMRSLSTTILKRILPNNDTESMIVMSMLRELLTTHLFGNILTTMSDPDYINSYIVDYLSVTETSGDKDAKDDNGEGIRNVVERAAESLMADGGFDDTTITPSTSNNGGGHASNTLGTQRAGSPEVFNNTLSPSSISPTSPTPPLAPPRKSATVPPPDTSSSPSSKLDSQSTATTNEPVITTTSPSPSTASLPPIPESQHSNVPIRSASTSPSMNNSSKKKISVPRSVDDNEQSPIIYPAGTVNFSIMDISSPSAGGTGNNNSPDKSKLMFIVQIERPAMEDNTGSEGGGYVITRTYADFEVFHAIISARHARRVARTNLRLPLDPIRSWLKLGSTTNASPITANDTESICRSLERYLHIVVQDNEMGRDQIIYAFLRKERRRNNAAGENDHQQGMDISFADEYMDEVSAYAALSSTGPSTNGYTPLVSSTTGSTSPASSAASSVGKAMSMLARAPSLAVKSVSRSSTASMTDDDILGSPGLMESRRWFGRKSTREGSISSIRSNNSSSGKEETDGELIDTSIPGTTSIAAATKRSSQQHQHIPSPPSTHVTTCSEDEGEDDDMIIMEEPDQVENLIDLEEEQDPMSRRRNTIDDGSGARINDNKPLSPLDIELLIETTFALVVEIFDLTTANNKAWMRRTLLNVLREVVRRSYTEIIAQHYSSYMNDYMSPDALVYFCNILQEKYWPGGVYNTEVAERTPEQKEATRQQARTLLMSSGVPAGVRQLIGDQNCNVAMDRLFTRLQDQGLNRVLILQLVERLVRPVFG